MSEKSVKYLLKMDKPKRVRAQSNSGRCIKQMSKRRYSKKIRNTNGKKMTSKPVVVEEANVEELVETNQLLTNVNNLIEPSIISAGRVELIELPKESILPTGFRFIDLSILSDCFLYVMRCAIRYHLYNLKNVKNTHG